MKARADARRHADQARVGRVEAERVVSQGAQMLMGSFDSGSTAAMVPVAQQRRVPFLVDIAAADPITANVAKSVKEGQQKVQYVYRNFPTGSSFGRKAVQYFTEIFAGGRRHRPSASCSCTATTCSARTRRAGFQAAHKAAKPVMGDRRGHPVAGAALGPLDRGLARQGGQARRHRADHAAGQRPAPAARDPQAAHRDARHRRPRQPWPLRGGPVRRPQGRSRVRDDQRARGRTSRIPGRSWSPTSTASDSRNGKTFDTNSGYSYDAMLAHRRRPGAGASPTTPTRSWRRSRRRTTPAASCSTAGPISFNEIGDNPNAITTMIQILGQKPVAVWPKEAAARRSSCSRGRRPSRRDLARSSPRACSAVSCSAASTASWPWGSRSSSASCAWSTSPTAT